MLKKNFKTSNGITLVALVITIIILLILVGITISSLTNTGLFGRTNEASEKSKMAEAKEKITMVLYEWKIEKANSNTNFEEFFNQKVTENSIDGFEKAEEGKYNIYKDSYVMEIDNDGNIVEDIQKSGPRPTISNIKITTDGITEVADNSQRVGTKLQINFDANMKDGTIKSVTPAVPYTTNGTETEIVFTIVGTVDGTDYKKTQKVSVENKYKHYDKLTADKLNVVLSATENKSYEDENGNLITIPAGFKIVSNDDTNNATTVDKGIVIEDATSAATAGSQFVWIPVGTIIKVDGSTVTINLDRYTFDTYGIPTAQGEKTVESYFSETSSGSGNTVAKSITDFKNSVSINGGYYIGRYEARKNTNGTITEVGTDTVWNNITQPDAAIQARNMYQNATTFISDLMNSYAWDTATLFLQTCGTNEKYSRKTSLNTGSIATTGTTNDIQCNVYDMASNVREWTTEMSNVSGDPCVTKGGRYDSALYYTSFRDFYHTSYSSDSIGFRPLLFVGMNS